MKTFTVLWCLAVATLTWGLRVEARPKPLITDAVTCCCRTHGGMCCAEVDHCGSFVPGCFCDG